VSHVVCSHNYLLCMCAWLTFSVLSASICKFRVDCCQVGTMTGSKVKDMGLAEVAAEVAQGWFSSSCFRGLGWQRAEVAEAAAEVAMVQGTALADPINVSCLKLVQVAEVVAEWDPWEDGRP
jgi:hypothetical protein